MTDLAKRPRLLVLSTTYPRWRDDHEPGFVHELARRLTDRFDVVAIVPHAEGALRREVLDGVTVFRYRYALERWETLVQDGGITTHLRRSPWKWLLVPGFFAMQWFSARSALVAGTVVHAHWIVLPGIVARLLRKRYLVTSHGADLFALRGKLAVRLKRWVMQRADATTVVSRAMLPMATELSAGKLPVVAPMGVDLSVRFTPDPAILRETDRIVFVGRLVEKKGLDVLLRAMPAVLAERPHAHLCIVGHGPLLETLTGLVRHLDIGHAVTFVGPVPSMALPEHYQRASLFVAPFRPASSGDQEGLGLVLVEALGCGCPVVTTDVDAVSDVLEGMSGVVQVPSGDERALSSAIIASLQDQTVVEAVASTRSILVDRFDWNHVARRYGDILSGLLDDQGN
ncbi:hypothetical protein GCM10009552_34730 [Rothia nasimurium]|uniref:Glycosyltransferase family 4 protein n=1 Tax=Luteibacter anthropi TaxID=564369 RepID=A0A7X5UED5_9GAMM|nr:glycosyltransferase [Luteibacter anthropi]NII08965.1 glycosyltransferase family 4 protein [Luteibacter anthropi]